MSDYISKYLPPSTVYLIGCTKSKTDRPTSAEKFYQGEVFKQAVGLVKKENAQWFVVSGKGGLLHPRDIVRPYDVNIAEQGEAVQRAWCANLREQIRHDIGNGGPLVLLMAPSYAALVKSVVADQLKVVTDQTVRAARPGWANILAAYALK